MVALGALISTAGSLNGNILISGQMPAAVARDGLAPTYLASKNPNGAPRAALLISSALATAVLLLNTNASLVATFTFLISLSTLAALAPYAVSALAELQASRKSAAGWALIAVLALAFTLIAMAGAGIKTLATGVVILVAGLPIFYWSKRRTP